jgi:hypothetical protein
MPLSLIAPRYVRPQVTDAIEMDVRGGQHPVVAAAECERVVSARNAHEDGSDGSGGGSINGSASGSGGFVFSPNDCVMEHARSRFWLMTGPNMYEGLVVSELSNESGQKYVERSDKAKIGFRCVNY